MGAAVASKSADTAAGAQRSPSFAQTSRPSRPARRTWPVRNDRSQTRPYRAVRSGDRTLAEPGDSGSAVWTHHRSAPCAPPSEGDSGSSALSAASRPRTTSADRSAGPPPGLLSPPQRQRCLSAGSPARQRRPPDSLHQAQRSCHSCQCQACTPLPIRPGHRIPRSGALLRPSARPPTAFIAADPASLEPGPGWQGRDAR